MRKLIALTALAIVAGLDPTPAQACGGMFCNTSPVDQNAERIIFEVGPDETTMTVQINYVGDDDSFAWTLPLADVPAPESLQVVPTSVLDFFRDATNPTFVQPPDCNRLLADSAGGPPPQASPAEPGNVMVHYEGLEVGPYEVAAVSSDDPDALIEWLNENDYTVTSPMQPYVRMYAEAGNKFLALKLQEEEGVDSIQPFRFTLPGTSPTIPLVISRIAMVPNMSIMAFVLADQRYQSANWSNVEIDPNEIRWTPFGGPNNYFNVVSNTIARSDSKLGWVTERAQSIEDLNLVNRARGFFTVPVFGFDEEDRPIDEDGELIEDAGREALLDMLDGPTYLTRLYTRVHPGVVNSDPMFRRSDLGDFDGRYDLPAVVDGMNVCEDMPETSPCDFVSCGPGGACRTTRLEDGSTVGACACAEGAAARTTTDPLNNVTTTCQDMRGSFMNPGDENGAGETLGDPCTSFSCGELGECVAINMTPTCRCAVGAVAYGWLDADGTSRSSCFVPLRGVPDSFYDDITLPEFELPGRIDIIDAMPRDPSTPAVTDLDERMEAGSCAASPVGTASGMVPMAFLALGMLVVTRRRR